MIVLGIDPGTAALGYGIVDRNGGGLRAIDFGCLTTSADLPLPERLVRIHDLVAELIETHHPAIVAVERLFFSKNAQTAFAVGQARGRGAARGRPGGRARPRGDAQRGQDGRHRATAGPRRARSRRMVSVILGLAEVPTPDDAADALAIAICCANAERPGDRAQRARRREGRRSWIAPRSRRSPAARRPTSGPSARRSAREAKAARRGLRPASALGAAR